MRLSHRQRLLRQRRIEKHLDDDLLTAREIATLERCGVDEVTRIRKEMEHGRTAMCSQCGKTGVCMSFRGGMWCLSCALPDTKPEVSLFRSSMLGGARSVGWQCIDV